MNLRVFQRRGKPVSANEMFFRNKKSGASTGFPLRRTLKTLRGAVELRCQGRRRRILRRRLGLSHQTIPKLNGVPPNGDGRNEKENPRGKESNPIVMRLNPVQGLRHA